MGWEPLGQTGGARDEGDGTVLIHWRNKATGAEYLRLDTLGGMDARWYEVRGTQLVVLHGEPKGFSPPPMG